MPEASHHEWQPVAAQVWTLFPGDRRATTEFGEPVQDPIDIGSRQTTGQLAIAERPGPSLAEEVVVVRVVFSTRVEIADAFHPFLDRRSSFQDQWSEAADCQVVGRQQTGGSRADHHRAFFQGCAARRGILERLGQVLIDTVTTDQLLEPGFLVCHVHGNRVDELEVVTGTSIEAFLEDSPAGHVGQIDAQPSGQLGPDVLFVERHRQPDVCHPQRHEKKACWFSVAGRLA